jgi:hypothetical protein
LACGELFCEVWGGAVALSGSGGIERRDFNALFRGTDGGPTRARGLELARVECLGFGIEGGAVEVPIAWRLPVCVAFLVEFWYRRSKLCQVKMGPRCTEQLDRAIPCDAVDLVLQGWIESKEVMVLVTP